MNLLLVDDEYYSVEGIRSSVLHMQLEFEQIYCAYNMQQAQELYLSNKIDIMISDIEMPKGSGLDLLKWMRNNGYNTVTIFLTSFANFNYASNAIKLQSIDYLLKPIDNEQLQNCMLNAIHKVRQLESQELYRKKSGYWDNSKRKLEEQFWNDLCMQIIPADTEQVLNELRKYHLSSTLLSQHFYIALLQAYIKSKEKRWEINLYEFAIKNIINEALSEANIDPILTRINNKQYILIIRYDTITDRSQYIKMYNRVLLALMKSLPGIFQLYISIETSLLHSGSVFKNLYDFAYNDIHEESKVIDITRVREKSFYTNSNFLNEWSNMLMQHRKDEVKERALHFLTELQKSDKADRSDLLRFHHDFIQIIYSLLEKIGKSAHKLFGNSASEQIFDQSCNSVEAMKILTCHMIDIFDDCLLEISSSNTSITFIKKYIAEHISEDLNRSELASLVYLSPDYLSHMFREKTGESVTSYILDERIKKAKELLLLSQNSISDIALMSGFPNISYFSRQFKKVSGKTPQEFRKERVKQRISPH